MRLRPSSSRHRNVGPHVAFNYRNTSVPNEGNSNGKSRSKQRPTESAGQPRRAAGRPRWAAGRAARWPADAEAGPGWSARWPGRWPARRRPAGWPEPLIVSRESKCPGRRPGYFSFSSCPSNTQKRKSRSSSLSFGAIPFGSHFGIANAQEMFSSSAYGLVND
jgi:hypothetical protein